MFGYFQSLLSGFYRDNTIDITVDDVDEKNNSSVDPLITAGDDMENNSSFNALEAIIKKGNDVNKKINSPFDNMIGKINAVKTGISELEEAGVHALPVSGLEELQEKKRAQMVDWIFDFTARIKKLESVPTSYPDTMCFSAVYILDCSLMKHAKRIYKLSDNRPVLIAAVKITATDEMGYVNEEALVALRSVIDELECSEEEIKHWEGQHAETFNFSTNAPSHMQSTHLLQKLLFHWSWIDYIMKPDEFQSGWLMVETLASFAVAKASLMERHNPLLLTSAIIRIVLDFFAFRSQLEDRPSSEMIQLLLGKESEHVPVALEILDWILSAEMMLPTLTEKMRDDFGFDAKSELQRISRHMRMSDY